MIQLITVIAFLLAAANVPFAAAVNLGLKFKEKDPSCAEEVKDVRDNIRSVKAFQTMNAVAWLVILILAICLDR